MANRHYAEIGDVWKHLPLAEILSVEKPRHYWESHAGSARYPLTPSLGRDYGARYFCARVADNLLLRASSYWRVLKALQPDVYPGSPWIAMALLRLANTQYLFCDLDGDSLRTIREGARELGVREVVCVQEDGIETLWQAAGRLSTMAAQVTLAHVDPYRPFEANPEGHSSLDLFGALSRRGVKTVLWYGYDSPGGRSVCWRHIRSALATYQLDPAALWCGEVNLVAMQEPGFINPGVGGCGIMTSNLSVQATSACVRLGEALAEMYREATFPGGQSGALDFVQGLSWEGPGWLV